MRISMIMLRTAKTRANISQGSLKTSFSIYVTPAPRMSIKAFIK